MKLDVLGLLGACSYALDCVEAELVHVTDKHAKRVAYMSVCMAEQMGIQGESLQDLTAGALLHDNALTQYIQEELHNDIASAIGSAIPLELGIHCAAGEKNMKDIPSHTDIKNVILYHHENADGSGYPNNLKGEEIPLGARILRVCDAFGALIANRPYRSAFDIETAISIMIEEVKNFDMRVFLTFQKVTQSENMKNMLTDLGIY